ncbi:MAG: carboxypeptidase-like regulatory domain-containing protein, partial [Acidobacteriota bacterium]
MLQRPHAQRTHPPLPTALLAALVGCCWMLSSGWGTATVDAQPSETLDGSRGALAAAQLAAAAQPGPTTPTLDGTVRGPDNPLAAAKVYAYEVGSYVLTRAKTDDAGRFDFQQLPAGLYKIIAFKPGFLPAVEVVMRRSRETAQSVHLLLRPSAEDQRSAESYWQLRSQIPADVLRDLANDEVPGVLLRAGSAGDAQGDQLDLSTLSPNQRFRADMAALGGVEGLGGGRTADTTRADLGVHTALGATRVGLEGRYQQLDGADGGTLAPTGAVGGSLASVSLHVADPRAGEVSVRSSSGELAPSNAARLAEGGRVDLRHHGVQWQNATGARGRTQVAASYTEESNYHRSALPGPTDVPRASRTWNVEGSYQQARTALGDIEAGVRYHQRTADGPFGEFDATIDDEMLDVYGRAGIQIQPRVMVEYGLYSTIRDGSLSLMPHGTFVVELGSDWRGALSAARRVERTDDDVLGGARFSSAFYDSTEGCERAAEACYEIRLGRGDEQRGVRIGALHRSYAETLRLHFNDDFFRSLQSLFVVRGDRLNGLQMEVTRRLTPKVLARLSSNVASGGGGIFYATDASTYENQVRYLVTALDTQFQQTATGLFI